MNTYSPKSMNDTNVYHQLARYKAEHRALAYALRMTVAEFDMVNDRRPEHDKLGDTPGVALARRLLLKCAPL